MGYNGFYLDGQVCHGHRIDHKIVLSDASLHNYRAFLKSHGFAERDPYSSDGGQRLSLVGHTVAGAFAGWTK